jgi:ribosomal-protein-alanine N-acetyltransferase
VAVAGAARPAPGLRRALEVGDRTFLRHPTARDAEEFVRLMRASRALHRPWTSPPADPEAFAAYVRRSRRADVDTSLVCRVRDGAIAGVCNLSQIVHGALCSAYLGYYATSPLAGRGYMSEGVGLVLRRAFTTLGLHRVEANIQPGNRDSLALAARCGFRHEGYSPRYLNIAGRWRDHERWAITVEEWRARMR